MENSDHVHVSIEMEKLADSLIAQLESLRPLSEECSIYRVPEPKRRLHPTHYTPQMVSIGPFHHGKEELQSMEEHKQRYLKYFLQRTQVRVAHFLAFIREREAKLRNCYAETIHLTSDEFVTMVLLDAVFLIELFLRRFKSKLRTDDDRIFRNSNLYDEIQNDIWLLENQIPLFILNDLFNLAITATYSDLYEEISFVAIACSWVKDSATAFLPIDENFLKKQFSKAQHFLDLIILCLQSSQSRAQTELKDLNIPGAEELHQAGVKFKPVSSENLLDIKFNEGILEIPFFTAYSTLEVRLRNLLTFESMLDYIGDLNDYIIMMNYLINSPKDAELLIQNGIIWLRETELLPNVFDNLDKDCVISKSSFKYSGVVADLQAHCKKPRNKWKAALKQNYFNTPWASISVAAAVILLLLTVTQTISSLIAL